ncbi:MAG: NADH-quinone oxidoreductase subunit L [Actinomycetota bacterium]|nr:NADH-quinone oxidoreductase subunit L [Actinomycetota bacterium]HZY64288.1 proton-conducting transporter membrane subunit [Rubrobacteraceae bacterium]
MTFVALSILGPLAAMAAILLVRRAAPTLALIGVGAGLIGAVVMLIRVAGGARYAATLPGLPEYPLRLTATPLTAALAAIVAVVGALVMLYAVGYMEEEGGKVRFFAQMSFFVAAMETLVLAGDWVLLLAAWEMIGLASYMLIGFWYEREGVGEAATRAFLYTRTADLGLYVGIFVLVSRAGTTEIPRTLEVGGTTALAASLLVLLAAAGKSAQTPLQGWLQDAMVGPTPVSALLHSATLVAAGAILLIRAFPLFPPGALLVVGILGGVTAVVAGLTAVADRDLKRLLAASTSSQYGFMLLALGAGSPVAALAHLTAHAAMKSSLFLGSGIFQHARGSTDFSKLAGIGRERPVVFAGFVVAGLALAGVPPLAGFWSKDAVIAATYESPYAWLLFPLALIGTALTGIYVAQALRLLWKGEKQDEPVAGMTWMGAGLVGLVVLAAGVGFTLEPLAHLVGGEIPKHTLTMVVGTVIALGGLALGWFVPAGSLLGPLRGPAEKGFRVGGGFKQFVARPALAVAQATDSFDDGIHRGVLGVGGLGLALARASRLTDEKGIDGLIFALVRGIRNLGRRARRLQTGLVHKELLLAVSGSALVLAFLTIGILVL